MLHTLPAGTRDAHLRSVEFLDHALRNSYNFKPGELVGVDRLTRRVDLGPICAPDGRVLVEPRSLP